MACAYSDLQAIDVNLGIRCNRCGFSWVHDEGYKKANTTLTFREWADKRMDHESLIPVMVSIEHIKQ